VRRLVGAWLFLAVILSGVLLFARLLAPGRFELELDVYILVLGALAVFNNVLAAGEAFPREERSALAEALDRDAPEAQRPAELDRLERELTMANASAFDTHARLRPVVREIVGVRLGARGLRLEDSEEVLGPELWELAREDRPAPADRHAPGTPAATLRRVVERLEKL
jgi:uncharacterized membrane protein